MNKIIDFLIGLSLKITDRKRDKRYKKYLKSIEQTEKEGKQNEDRIIQS